MLVFQKLASSTVPLLKIYVLKAEWPRQILTCYQIHVIKNCTRYQVFAGMMSVGLQWARVPWEECSCPRPSVRSPPRTGTTCSTSSQSGAASPTAPSGTPYSSSTSRDFCNFILQCWALAPFLALPAKTFKSGTSFWRGSKKWRGDSGAEKKLVLFQNHILYPSSP